MPIEDIEPGTSPEAPGNWYFYKQGSATSTGAVISSEGDGTFAGNGSFGGNLAVTGSINGSNIGGAGQIVISSTRTADAGTAINEAIAALPSGGTIIIPAGTWTIDTAILISQNGLIIRGISQNRTLLRFNPASVSAAIAMADTTQRYAVIRDLRIEATSSGSAGTAIDASYFVNSVFDNLRIGATGQNPLKGIIFNVIGSYYNIVQNCRISVSGVGSQCIAFDNTSNSNVVSNCRLVGDANTTGVYVNAHAIEINRVDCESSMSVGIDIGATGHDCTIISPYLEAISTGLRLAANVEAATVVGGIIIDCTTANITDNGAKGFNMYNTRVQYDPLSRISVWNPAFATSYPAPGNMDQPQDHGSAFTWSIDPAAATATSLLTNGTIYLSRVRLQNNVVGATKLWYIVTAAAVTPTAGQSWIGLYDSTGAKVTDVNIDAGMAASGPQSATISTTNLSPGYYWVAFLCNAATAVTLARAGGQSAAGNSFNQTNANLRFAVNGTGATTLPSSITPASNTTTGSIGYFTAVS